MRKVVLYCLAPCAVVLHALAADSKLEHPDLGRYLRWGPLRARPGLTLSRFGYDDNILFTSDNNPNNRVGDLTATLSPRLDGLLLFGRSAFLTFRQRLDYTAYATRTDQNFLDNHTSGRLTIPFRRRYGVFGEILLDLTHLRPVDLEAERPELRRNKLAIGLILEPGWRTEIEIARTFDDYRYTDPQPSLLFGRSIADRLDRTESGTTLDIRYRALGRTRIVLSGLFKEIDFDKPFSLEIPPSSGNELTVDRSTDEWRAQAGLQFGEGGALTGIFLLGWSQIDALSPILEDLSEPVGEAKLAYRLNSRTRFELEGERLPGFAVYGLNSYYLLSNLGLRGIYYFNRLVGFESGVARGRLTFPASPNLLGREDDLRRYELGVRLRMLENSIGRRVEYSFRVRYYRRTSTVPAFDTSVFSFGFGANLGY